VPFHTGADAWCAFGMDGRRRDLNAYAHAQTGRFPFGRHAGALRLTASIWPSLCTTILSSDVYARIIDVRDALRVNFLRWRLLPFLPFTVPFIAISRCGVAWT